MSKDDREKKEEKKYRRQSFACLSQPLCGLLSWPPSKSMGDGCSLRPPDATAIPFKILLTHKFALFASWTTSQSSTLYTYHIISLTSLFPSGLSCFAFIPSFLFICSFFCGFCPQRPLAPSCVCFCFSLWYACCRARSFQWEQPRTFTIRCISQIHNHRLPAVAG